MRRSHSRKHLVRPRWVWGGLAVALFGAAGVGLGIALLSLWICLVGSAVLIAGMVSSVAGGIFYDSASSLSARRELRQVADRDVHPGAPAADVVNDPAARRGAAQANVRSRAARSKSAPPGTSLAPPAGWLLVGMALFVMISQPWFIAYADGGRGSAQVVIGLVIVIGLSGLRIALGSGRFIIAGTVVGLAGAGLVIGGILAERDREILAVVEVLCGAITIVIAAVVLFGPASQPAAASAGHRGDAE